MRERERERQSGKKVNNDTDRGVGRVFIRIIFNFYRI